MGLELFFFFRQLDELGFGGGNLKKRERRLEEHRERKREEKICRCVESGKLVCNSEV